MEQVKSFCRRYRRLLLAAAYLAIFAVGVLYLRVTVNIPPEGDDKLTLNLWLYDFQRMPFWQYALQDLQGRLRYFTLQEVRFFPFHYPNAVDLLFYTSLTHYRLYIIAWTGAAAFAVSRVAARLGSGDALALGGFALALAAAPIWNEGMYSYYAVPQRALFWAMTAWLCLFAWQGTRHRRWAVLGAVLSFIACGTYEIGYVFALLALVVWLLRRRSVKNALLDTAPALGGMGAALVFHVRAQRRHRQRAFSGYSRRAARHRAADGRVAPWAELPPFAGGRRGHHERGSAVAAGAGCAGRTVDLLRRAV